MLEEVKLPFGHVDHMLLLWSFRSAHVTGLRARSCSLLFSGTDLSSSFL